MSWVSIQIVSRFWAIATRGSTCGELAVMGLPRIVIALNENQIPTAEYLGRIGLVVDLDWYYEIPINKLALPISKLLLSDTLQKDMNQLGQALIDSFESAKVASKMRALAV